MRIDTPRVSGSTTFRSGRSSHRWRPINCAKSIARRFASHAPRRFPALLRYMLSIMMHSMPSSEVTRSSLLVTSLFAASTTRDMVLRGSYPLLPIASTEEAGAPCRNSPKQQQFACYQDRVGPRRRQLHNNPQRRRASGHESGVRCAYCTVKEDGCTDGKLEDGVNLMRGRPRCREFLRQLTVLASRA